MIEPTTVVKMSGKVKDFKQIDNLYTVVKREGSKLLEDWTLEITVDYKEEQNI